MNFLSFFFPQKNTDKSPITHKKVNYVCEDSELEWNIKAYLNRDLSAKECIQNFLEFIAYNNYLHLIENQEIFEIIEDFLRNATWKTEWTIDCGDFNPQRPEPWLSCVYNVYTNLLFDINVSETLLKNMGKEITTAEVMKVIQNKTITLELYENKSTLKDKETKFKAIICSGNFTPLEAFLLIKENWNLLYPYQSTYEALIYIVTTSENHTVHKYFDSAFRDYGYKMGIIYKKAKEKQI